MLSPPRIRRNIDRRELLRRHRSLMHAWMSGEISRSEWEWLEQDRSTTRAKGGPRSSPSSGDRKVRMRMRMERMRLDMDQMRMRMRMRMITGDPLIPPSGHEEERRREGGEMKGEGEKERRESQGEGELASLSPSERERKSKRKREDPIKGMEMEIRDRKKVKR